jgi:hypothetical protein
MWSATEFAQGLSQFHGQNRPGLARAGELSYQQMGRSFSQCLGKSFPESIAALFAKKEMTTEQMLEGHSWATLARYRASSGSVIMAIQPWKAWAIGRGK